jgi:hypothetical protein
VTNVDVWVCALAFETCPTKTAEPTRAVTKARAIAGSERRTLRRTAELAVVATLRGGQFSAVFVIGFSSMQNCADI